MGPLTQQYVKLTLLDTALKAGDTQAAQAAVTQKGLAGVTRKLQELKYSIQLEKEQTKDQILQGYLNIVYYGDQAYGVQAASKHYFNKDAKDLGLPERPCSPGWPRTPARPTRSTTRTRPCPAATSCSTGCTSSASSPTRS